MKILGIDPGSRATGYGIIEKHGSELSFVAAGAIKTTPGASMPVRIKQIFAGLTQVIALEKPDTAAIEQVFMATNPDAALKLGQARGAAIAAMTALDLEVSEYTARQIKQSAAGYGAASKEQMQHMVAKLLRHDEPLSFDAADALACAICHAHFNHSLNKLLGTTTNTAVNARRKKGRWRL